MKSSKRPYSNLFAVLGHRIVLKILYETGRTRNDQYKTRSLLQKENGKPLVISGPCSAETEFQIMVTARALKFMGTVDILRAGIWKPHTRPRTFEGVGAKRYVSRQVEQALKHGIEVLCIGSRTNAFISFQFLKENLNQLIVQFDQKYIINFVILPEYL